jgi:hypothetical protein
MLHKGDPRPHHDRRHDRSCHNKTPVWKAGLDMVGELQEWNELPDQMDNDFKQTTVYWEGKVSLIPRSVYNLALNLRR